MRLMKFRLACLLMVAGVVAGCSTPRIPYTAAEAREAQVGIADARTWGDYPDASFGRRAARVIRLFADKPTYLALSGGGGDGAYGAGILNGWTRSGRRPEFTIVSGVSTGALLAPFAFLGPRYDETVRHLYTSGVAESLLSDPSIVGAVFGSSIFSSDRLKTLVARYITPELVAEVARESEKGRMLLVLTTNLDSQRPVLWDLGAIARSGGERGVELFRTVMVASASVPAVFPPTLIDAEAGGRSFQEMHVDGGISANVFTLPRSFLWSEAARGAPLGRGRMYIVINTMPLPDFQPTEDRTTAVVGRTIGMSLNQQIRLDLSATYDAAQRSGFSFSLTYIRPEDVASLPGSGPLGFETERMRRLYEIGYQRGSSGAFWQTKPPDVSQPTEGLGKRIAAR
jgi:predicted acylesterase/phospholipase RssA